MRVSHELRIFFIILISTSLIFSFSHFGVLAFEGLVSKSKQYPENTLIGPVNASGLDEATLTEILVSKVSDWQSNANIQLTYQEASASLPLDEFLFNIEESLAQIQEGTTNKLLVSMELLPIQTTLTSLSTDFTVDLVDIDLLKTDLLGQATTLEPMTKIKVENYLLKPVIKEQIIHSVSLSSNGTDLANIGATLVFEPNSTFSLLDYIEKHGLLELDLDAVSLLASGVYQAILPTNFKMTERHIGTELYEGIKLGYEAKVNSQLRWDLSFHNPNNEQYRIEIYTDGKEVIFDLIGTPFLYNYSITEDRFQEFAPKTIKQYSPLLNPGESKITKNGQKGYYLEISRLVRDGSNTVIEEKIVSKDYYPPIHQIEVFGLIGASIPADASGVEESTVEEGTEIKDSSKTNASTDGSLDSKMDGTDEDTLWGKTDEIEK